MLARFAAASTPPLPLALLSVAIRPLPATDHRLQRAGKAASHHQHPCQPIVAGGVLGLSATCPTCAELCPAQNTVDHRRCSHCATYCNGVASAPIPTGSSRSARPRHTAASPLALAGRKILPASRAQNRTLWYDLVPQYQLRAAHRAAKVPG